MSDLKVSGTISKILKVETGQSKAGKEWKKQNFVLDTNAEYNNLICFQLFGDKKLEAFSRFKEGERVEVSFNVSSREYNDKYYHNLDAWKLEKLDSDTKSDQPKEIITPEEDDDLPF